jgi:hypothetical protein
VSGQCLCHDGVESPFREHNVLSFHRLNTVWFVERLG